MENDDNFLKFRKLLKFVFENEKSDFYRKKYEKAEFNPASDFNSLEDIKKIPLLSKEEISGLDPLRLLFVEEKEVDGASSTSGTTGEPIIIFSSKRVDPPIPLERVNFGKCLILVSPFRIYVSSFWKERGNLVLIGDIHNIPASLQLASKLNVNTIHTTPTLAIILKDYLDRYPNLNKSLKFIKLGGEVVNPSKKKILQKLYPSLKIFTTYALCEGGRAHVASQCPFLAGDNSRIYYHPELRYFHFEIVDPDTGKNVEDGKNGELVLTRFGNWATPIIRYKTGDLASFQNNNCPCGHPGPLLQILGRAKYDTVKVGGVELRRGMVEKAILNLKDYLDESFEVNVYENFLGNKPKIKVVINLQLRKGIKESSALRQKIENEFLENLQLSPRLNLRRAVEVGLFESPQINFIKHPLSAKTKQVLILHQS